MVVILPVMLFWLAVAVYVALSLDGAILHQDTVVKYLRNIPFNAMPITNGLLLGFLTIGMIFFTLAVIPSRKHIADEER